MKVRDALLAAASQLTGKSGTPNLDAELILCWLKDWDRLQTILRAEEALAEDDEMRYDEAIAQRRAGKPVQYIIGTQEFMGLLFCVDERVLIPRPDTETLVEAVLNKLKDTPSPSVLDLCTGSGAIAISLAYGLNGARVTGTDISEDALEVARENGRRLVPGHEPVWRKGDLFEALEPEAGPYDAIVSNPPYIPPAEIQRLEANVRDYEPWGALDGGQDGLIFYPPLIAGAGSRLKPGGILALEIGWDQGEQVMAMVREDRRFAEPVLLQDLAGKDRVVLAEKAGPAIS